MNKGLMEGWKVELSKVDQSRDKFQFFSIDPAKGLANIPLQKLGPIRWKSQKQSFDVWPFQLLSKSLLLIQIGLVCM